MALKQYGLDKVRLRLVGKVHNHILRVVATPRRGGRTSDYALRMHLADWHSDEMIESELAWLEALGRETELIVPRPVRNHAGRLLTKLVADADDRSRCSTWSLLHWTEGRLLWKKPSAEWLRKIGRLMAQLQRHGGSFARSSRFRRPRWDTAAMLGRRGILAAGWDALPARAVHVFGDVCERVEAASAEIGAGPGCFGLIHGDLHIGNVLSHGGTAAPIDFDDCCDGYYLSDIAATLDFLECRDAYEPLREAFLDGYSQVQPLPARQARHINSFLAARWVMLCLFLARRPETRPTLDRILAIVLPKLRRFLRQPRTLG